MSQHITPLVINALGCGHTDRQADRQTYRQTETISKDQVHAGLWPALTWFKRIFEYLVVVIKGSNTENNIHFSPNINLSIHMCTCLSFMYVYMLCTYIQKKVRRESKDVTSAKLAVHPTAKNVNSAKTKVKKKHA